MLPPARFEDLYWLRGASKCYRVKMEDVVEVLTKKEEKESERLGRRYIKSKREREKERQWYRR